jgi:Na+/H+ antiporter NhaC
MAALLSGAMFGDNLSIISDTTIAATQTQGCKMNDKFKVNIFIALPAAMISMIFFLYLSPDNIITPEVMPLNLNNIILIIPYLVVLIMAISGINVFLVLILGILSAGIIGFSYDNFDIIGYAKIIYNGFANMNEIFLLTMLTGGLAKLVEYGGGINYILEKSELFIKGKKTAQLASGFIILLLDIALANNTLAIIISSPVIVNIRKKYNIDKRKMAALIDIFSCVAQGLLPFGAQILIMFKFADNSIDYLDILPYMLYLYILFILAIVSIITSKFDEKLLKLI